MTETTLTSYPLAVRAPKPSPLQAEKVSAYFAALAGTGGKSKGARKRRGDSARHQVLSRKGTTAQQRYQHFTTAERARYASYKRTSRGR